MSWFSRCLIQTKDTQVELIDTEDTQLSPRVNRENTCSGRCRGGIRGLTFSGLQFAASVFDTSLRIQLQSMCLKITAYKVWHSGRGSTQLFLETTATSVGRGAGQFRNSTGLLSCHTGHRRFSSSNIVLIAYYMLHNCILNVTKTFLLLQKHMIAIWI